MPSTLFWRCSVFKLEHVMKQIKACFWSQDGIPMQENYR